MKEKDFYTLIGGYYAREALRVKRTIVWEAKITKTDSLPYSCLLPHQEDKMLEAERSLNYKIPDVGIGRKPCDGITVYGAYPVIVAIFYKPRATEIFEIPLRVFIANRHYAHGRKSLTLERARVIGTPIYLYERTPRGSKYDRG